MSWGLESPVQHWGLFLDFGEFFFPWWLSQKKKKKICLQHWIPEFDPWVGEIPWRREWQPTPVFLPGESHGQRMLEAYGVSKSQTQLSD